MNVSHVLPEQVLPRHRRKRRHVFPFVWSGTKEITGHKVILALLM